MDAVEWTEHDRQLTQELRACIAKVNGELLAILFIIYLIIGIY
jgi:hypothetical protein